MHHFWSIIQEKRELEKAKREFAQAWRESRNASTAGDADASKDSTIKHFVSEEVDYVSDRLSASEWNRVKSAVANHKKLNYHYEKSSDGDIIIPINNKLVYTDANYDSPGISKIIEIDSNIETEIDEARSWIYYAEEGKYSLTDTYEVIESITGYEIINEYKQKGSESVKGYDRRTSRGKSRSDSYHSNYLQERNRRAREIIHSVNSETSSKDGVFFDAENKSNVRYSIAEDKQYAPKFYSQMERVVADIVERCTIFGASFKSYTDNCSMSVSQ